MDKAMEQRDQADAKPSRGAGYASWFKGQQIGLDVFRNFKSIWNSRKDEEKKIVKGICGGFSRSKDNSTSSLMVSKGRKVLSRPRFFLSASPDFYLYYLMIKSRYIRELEVHVLATMVETPSSYRFLTTSFSWLISHHCYPTIHHAACTEHLLP